MKSAVSAVLGAALAWTLAQAAAAQCLDAGIDEAFRRQDLGELKRIAATTSSGPAFGSNEAELMGLATYRVATLLSIKGSSSGDEVKPLLEAAVTRIEPVWEKERKPGVAAVLSMLYGFQIGMSPVRGVLLGKRTQEMLEDAEQLGTVSPRLHVAEGLSRLYRPEWLGGGPTNAAVEFRQALAGFARSPATQGLCWGRDDALLGMARAKIKLNERPEAFAILNDILNQYKDHPVARGLLNGLRAAQVSAK